MTSEQPPAQDKLAEIEERHSAWLKSQNSVAVDMKWLIDEVKRLRGLSHDR